jgi:mannose-1-phosphate guanylyltransferase
MIMVFKVRTLLEMLQTLYPTIYRQFARIFDAIGTPAEMETVEAVYQTIEPMNFSKDFLEKVADAYPDAISVLPVLQVFWSDLGSPQRIAQVLELLGQKQPITQPSPAKRKPPRYNSLVARGELL